MKTELNKLIAGLFSDSKNIHVLCSIYDNEITANSIAGILNMNLDEITERLETPCEESLIVRKKKGNDVVYSLANPKVCDSILMLRDSIGHPNQYRS